MDTSDIKTKSKVVERDPGFEQVCVWRGTLILNREAGDNLDPETKAGKKKLKEFADFMKENMGVRVQYLEEVKTLPDQVNGREVEETGGRNDALFAVHQEDISSFAVKRLGFGISWIEDALDNNPEIYPERITEYRTW